MKTGVLSVSALLLCVGLASGAPESDYPWPPVAVWTTEWAASTRWTPIALGFVCPADANADGAVGLEDFNIVLNGFGSSDPNADLDGDGLVGLRDLNIRLAGFGSDC